MVDSPLRMTARSVVLSVLLGAHPAWDVATSSSIAYSHEGRDFGVDGAGHCLREERGSRVVVMVGIAEDQAAVRALGEHHVGSDVEQFGLGLFHLGAERGRTRHVCEGRVAEHGGGREDRRTYHDAGRLCRKRHL